MRFTSRGHKAIIATATVALAASGLAACGSGGSGGGNSKSVTLWTSVDDPIVAGWKKQLVPEAKKQGITLTIKKVNNINQIIMTKIQGGGAPDIATIPQPGVVADIVKRNAAQPLDTVLSSAQKSSLVAGAADAGTVNGKLYGLLVSMNVKSLVFYPKKAWATAGYAPPTSIDGLNALADKMRADGNTPWCMGIGSDAATGWPATDWFEDLIMRYGSVQDYKDWVSHKMKFDSPLVKQAAAEFEKVAFTPGNVAGGRKSIASTPFGDAGTPMFDAKPGCWMLKQGSFITTFFPKSVQADLDANVGVFGFPPATEGGDNPTLGGGDLAVLLSKNDNAKKVIKLMAASDFGTDAAKESGSTYLSPHKDFPIDAYQGDLTKQFAQIAYKSTALLYDGSDSMPGAVGAGSFWKQMTAWISGQTTLDKALKAIDASWPSS